LYSPQRADTPLRSPARLPLTLKARHHSTRRGSYRGTLVHSMSGIATPRGLARGILARMSEQIGRAAFHFAKSNEAQVARRRAAYFVRTGALFTAAVNRAV